LENFPRISPFLWFDANAEEAADFYVSVFKNSRRLDQLRNPDGSSGPKGKVLTVAFELDGQKFTALNGGPMFKFSEAIFFGAQRLATGSGRILVQAFCRRQRESVRLAEGQIRPLVADCACEIARTGQESESHEGHDGHEKKSILRSWNARRNRSGYPPCGERTLSANN
jgi:3-demethylubiquinone-9 3-methyltransferase